MPDRSLGSLPWGKSNDAGRTQTLRDHCRDVAAVFSALCRLPGLRRRLAKLAGVSTFADVWIDRLAWFVFLHDLGKVNWGFQHRIDPAAPAIGHVKPIGSGWQAVLQQLECERLADWADDEQLLDWFHAVLSHHGKPWTEDPVRVEKDGLSGYRQVWDRQGDYEPLKELKRLRHAADAMFERAFAKAPPIPLTSPLIHTLAGLAMLADWIASSDWPNSPSGDAVEAWASGWLRRIGLDPEPWRRDLDRRDPTFSNVFPFQPSPAQTAFAAAEGPLVVLESETGSGKTEAALWRFVIRFRAGRVDGLYFALPTRTAAVQLCQRIEKMLERLWPDGPPHCVLAVPGYLEDGGEGALPAAADALDASENDTRQPSVWASEHPKRYFAGLIAVGTIDQALLAAIRTKHAHMRGAALMRLMLVIDEVHSSDPYMAVLTEGLLQDHLAAGGEAALLSATLGARTRVRYASIGRTENLNDIEMPPLAVAVAQPYPAITANAPNGGALAGIDATGRTKNVTLTLAPLIDDAEAIAAKALAAAAQGAKVLVVRNTVTGAVAVQTALEAMAGPDAPVLFRVNGVPTLHHGRFAREDRRLLDAAVEKAVGKARPDGGKIVVGSQTLEQSLDIDADFLITDLCPIDVLLQRLGRLHRHLFEPDGMTPRRRPPAFQTPAAIVLTPADGLVTLLDGRHKGRDSHGLGPMLKNGKMVGVYPDVIALELTARLVRDRPRWSIPAMNRALVEQALHPEAKRAFIEAQDEAGRDIWQQHDNAVWGSTFADASTARTALLKRAAPFMHESNIQPPDERFTTRLGDAGFILDLPKGTIGPFGTPIRKLAIPSWMTSGVFTSPTVLVDQEHLLVEEKMFIYNSLGLFSTT